MVCINKLSSRVRDAAREVVFQAIHEETRGSFNGAVDILKDAVAALEIEARKIHISRTADNV
jgi:hypothetical protein